MCTCSVGDFLLQQDLDFPYKAVMIVYVVINRLMNDWLTEAAFTVGLDSAATGD